MRAQMYFDYQNLSAMGIITAINTMGGSGLQPMVHTPLDLHRQPLHKVVPYVPKLHIVPLCVEVFDAPPAALPQFIVGHTYIKVFAIVTVEVVTLDQVNNMIFWGQTVSNQFIAFFREYGCGSVRVSWYAV